MHTPWPSGACGRVASVAALSLLCLLTIPATTLASDADEPDPMDLDLEKILDLDLNLNAMGLTRIHHTHLGGEWMVGYQFMSGVMRGNRNGTSRVGHGEVLGQFKVAPTSMSMQMHMLHLMYAPSDRWTLAMMAPFIRLQMAHRTRTGGRFTTRSRGIGDLKLTGLFSAWRRDRDDRTERVVVETGASLPTGSINARDRMPSGRGTLPYPMQLGSGTLDLRPGLTYLYQSDDWNWGGHIGSTLRFYDNRHDYRLGNRGKASLWAAHKLAGWLSASLRVDGESWGDIHGSDPRLDKTLVPTADPDLRGGRRLDLLAGVNLFALSGPLNGHRISIELGHPIYQSLDGPQLETDWRMQVSWNLTFRP